MSELGTVLTSQKRPTLRGLSEIRAFFRTNTQPSTSSARPRSTFSAWTVGSVTSATSSTTTPGTATTPASSPRRRSRRGVREQRGDQQLPAARQGGRRPHRAYAVRACSRWWPWSSSTRRPRCSVQELGLRPVPALRGTAPPAGLQDRHHAASATRRAPPACPTCCLTGWTPGRSSSDLAELNRLGTDLVVQPPYGDSGQTTFFVTIERTGTVRRTSSASKSRS